MRLPYTDLTRVRALPNIGRARRKKGDARNRHSAGTHSSRDRPVIGSASRRRSRVLSAESGIDVARGSVVASASGVWKSIELRWIRAGAPQRVRHADLCHLPEARFGARAETRRSTCQQRDTSTCPGGARAATGISVNAWRPPRVSRLIEEKLSTISVD
jgi:hypothetical protein